MLSVYTPKGTGIIFQKGDLFSMPVKNKIRSSDKLYKVIDA